MEETLPLQTQAETIKILQQKLKELGFYKGLITGELGPSTEEGIRAFQREENLEETGTLTPSTWEKLFELTEQEVMPISVYPTLRRGSTGKEVTDLQTKLQALLYYTGKVNGNFDLETENAVKRFQLNNQLTADGVVGSQTWNVINNRYGNLKDCSVSSPNTYTVQSGDTLYGIARKFNTTVSALQELNGLTNNIVRVGQVLKIPNTSEDDYITYQVVSGDTLSKIATRYGTTVNEIKSLNNLTSDLITVGQILKIPTKNQSSTIRYVVQKGDTLYGIANRYDVSVATLKSLNNLVSDVLQIGQVLEIPTSADTNYITYQVKSGDTLYGLASRYQTSVEEIKRFNNLSNNILQIGQVLKIPL